MPTRKNRLLVVLVIFLLLFPAIVSTVTYKPVVDVSSAQGVPDRIPAEDITFVTAQGKEFSSTQAQLVAFNTKTKEPVWVHKKYDRYLGVDPLGENRLLVVARSGGEDLPIFSKKVSYFAVIINWRTGETIRRFPVPPATHDVDYLHGDDYAVADLKHSRAYVYNTSEKKIVWEYHFRKHFPKSAGGGIGGYTHLNDIDVVDNGSAFLLSPRNFDRVMLVDRATKKIRWTLGEEDNYSILNEQHNPVILSQNPLTLLVADSENDRVIEYRRTNDGWKQDWAYTNLSWPRDADRLPNGNTMIVDSNNQRALVVTPEGTTVWSVHILFEPYDIERPVYGDEPADLTMREIGNPSMNAHAEKQDLSLSRVAAVVSDVYDSAYTTSQWVLPPGIGQLEYGLMLMAGVLTVIWTAIEAYGVILRFMSSGTPRT